MKDIICWAVRLLNIVFTQNEWMLNWFTLRSGGRNPELFSLFFFFFPSDEWIEMATLNFINVREGEKMTRKTRWETIYYISRKFIVFSWIWENASTTWLKWGSRSIRKRNDEEWLIEVMTMQDRWISRKDKKKRKRVNKMRTNRI